MSTTKRLYRVNENKVFLGVSTGLAEYFNIDVNIVRIIFVVLSLTAGGFPIIVYFVFAIVLPIKEVEIAKAETVEVDNKDDDYDDEYAYNEDDYKI